MYRSSSSRFQLSVKPDQSPSWPTDDRQTRICPPWTNAKPSSASSEVSEPVVCVAISKPRLTLLVGRQRSKIELDQLSRLVARGFSRATTARWYRIRATDPEAGHAAKDVICRVRHGPSGGRVRRDVEDGLE